MLLRVGLRRRPLREARDTMITSVRSVHDRRALVVSIHDVCPRFLAETREWLGILNAWDIRRCSLAVVPRYEDGASACGCGDLMDLLREQLRLGNEVVLHGYTHRRNGRRLPFPARIRDALTTRGCAEFCTADAAEARERIARGKRELESALQTPLQGFIPPGWWQAAGMHDVLLSLGFLFCTSTTALSILPRRRRVYAPAITGLPEPRNVFARLAHAYCFGWLPVHLRRRPLMRMALHPYDLRNPVFRDSVERLLRRLRAERTAMTYEEFCS